MTMKSMTICLFMATGYLFAIANSCAAITYNPQTIVYNAANGHRYQRWTVTGFVNGQSFSWDDANTFASSRPHPSPCPFGGPGYLMTVTTPQEWSLLCNHNSLRGGGYLGAVGMHNSDYRWVVGPEAGQPVDMAGVGAPFNSASANCFPADRLIGVGCVAMYAVKASSIYNGAFPCVSGGASFIVEWSSCCPDNAADTDLDGLLDSWEVCGIPYQTGSGTAYYHLPGADPLHKDLYVEVDALTGRAPTAGPLDSVVAAFAGAPVTNPDGSTGISLHIPGQGGANPGVDDIDEAAVPWLGVWADFDAYKANHFGSATERVGPNSASLLAAKAKAYRYCIFADVFDADGSSGLARDIPSRDFMVTLGGWLSAFGSLTSQELAGTFMHELGHALGLHHGGGDDINGKPNYYSVMNYLWQAPVRTNSTCAASVLGPINRYRDSWRLTYSGQTLFPLDESSLNEAFGFGGSPNVWVPIGPPVGTATTFGDIIQMGGSVNWDRIGNATATSVQADANFLRDCAGQQAGSPGQYLSGFNDWPNLQYGVPSPKPQPTEIMLPQAIGGELTVGLFAELGSLQLDCNLNGLPDDEDLSNGRSQDFNGNGVPDECDAGVVGVGEQPIPSPLQLTLNSNPVIGGASAEFTLWVTEPAGRSTLRIFDIVGREVAIVFDGSLFAGIHNAIWNIGEVETASGIYFAVLSTPSGRAMTRFVLIR